MSSSISGRPAPLFDDNGEVNGYVVQDGPNNVNVVFLDKSRLKPDRCDCQNNDCSHMEIVAKHLSECDIDKMPIHRVRTDFAVLMGRVITKYGDDQPQ